MTVSTLRSYCYCGSDANAASHVLPHHRAVTSIYPAMCMNSPFCAAVKSSPVTWAKKQNCDSKLPDSLHVPRLITNPGLAYSAHHVRQTHGPNAQAGIVFPAGPEPVGITATFYANSATCLAELIHWIAYSEHINPKSESSLPDSSRRHTDSKPSSTNSERILSDSKRSSPDSEHTNSNFKHRLTNYKSLLANPEKLFVNPKD